MDLVASVHRIQNGLSKNVQRRRVFSTEQKTWRETEGWTICFHDAGLSKEVPSLLPGEEGEKRVERGQTVFKIPVEETVEVGRERICVLRTGPLRRWRNLPHRGQEIGNCDVNTLPIDLQLLAARVDGGIRAMKRAESRLRTESLQIRSRVASCEFAQRLLNVFGNGRIPVAQMNSENLTACLLVWKREEQLAVESSGSSQRRVDRIDAVGGANHDYLASVVQSIHQRQQR